MKIELENKYRLKRDGTIWEVLGIEYPMDSHDPDLGTVTLFDAENSAIQVGETVFWECFEIIEGN